MVVQATTGLGVVLAATDHNSFVRATTLRSLTGGRFLFTVNDISAIPVRQAGVAVMTPHGSTGNCMTTRPSRPAKPGK
jgi:hypothetical protein